MKKFLYLLTPLVVLFLFTRTGESHVFSALSTGMPVRWNLANPPSSIIQNGRLIYNLNPAGSDDLTFTQVEAAFAASFKVWEDVPTSNFAFTRGPNRTETGAANDNIFQIYWLENSTTGEDGFNIAGTLAVTRTLIFTSGARAGELADASMIFNGVQFQWAVDGRADRIDLAEVAAHEIGHVIGFSHSPIGVATMFPRTGAGVTRGRSLALDDQIGVSVAYPQGNFLTATGALKGRVKDGGGNNILGANIVASDANGQAVANTLSQADGTYSLRGLPPGAYTVFAAPIDAPGGFYYSRDNLFGYYANAVTDFATTGDQRASLQAGVETTLDFTVTRGAPPFIANLVRKPAGGFVNAGIDVQQGQSNVTIGVGGSGLPQTGAPLSVSGVGVTVLRSRFGQLTNGGNAIEIDINVSPTAPLGARSLIVANGAQRAIIPGVLEITGGGPVAAVSTVSAAGYATNVARESIAAAFGNNLATTTAKATTRPLPTDLAGTTVTLRDSAGVERLAPLFFVSPGQVNYQLAPGLPVGPATVTITSGGATSVGSLTVESVAPGLFTANATNGGVAAAQALRIRNGVQTYEAVARLDTAQQKFVSVPIDLGPATDQVFLVLFGTGVRFRNALSSVVATAGGRNLRVTFAGAQGTLIGVDQINALLDRSLIGRGEIDLTLSVEGKLSNTVQINIR